MSTTSVSVAVVRASRESILLAMFLNSGALGILTVQVYLYYISFTQDPIYCKILVYGVFILEIAQSIMGTRTVFQSLVYDYTDALSMDRVRDLWFSFPILGGIVTFVVQIFYARRILILGAHYAHGKAGGFVIISLSLFQFATNIVLGVEVRDVGSFWHTWDMRERAPFLMFNSFGIACDVMIAVYMTIFLTRSSPGTHRTRKLVRNIVRLTIETGALTALVLIVNIILGSFPRRQYSYYHVTNTLISKLYANSVLVILNSRMELTKGVEKKMPSELHFTPFDVQSQGSGTNLNLCNASV